MADPVPFAEWYADLERPPRLRFGQAAFHSLVEVRPELAEVIGGGPLDPYPDERVWRRSQVPTLLPGVTERMCAHWQKTGYWRPEFPSKGSGHNAYVTLADLEGLAVLSNLAPFLFKPGPDFGRGSRCPSWAEIRRACEEGGVWLATREGSWVPWNAAQSLPSAVAVVVDVEALMANLPLQPGPPPPDFTPERTWRWLRRGKPDGCARVIGGATAPTPVDDRRL